MTQFSYYDINPGQSINGSKKELNHHEQRESFFRKKKIVLYIMSIVLNYVS